MTGGISPHSAMSQLFPVPSCIPRACTSTFLNIRTGALPFWCVRRAGVAVAVPRAAEPQPVGIDGIMAGPAITAHMPPILAAHTRHNVGVCPASSGCGRGRLLLHDRTGGLPALLAPGVVLCSALLFPFLGAGGAIGFRLGRQRCATEHAAAGGVCAWHCFPSLSKRPAANYGRPRCWSTGGGVFVVSDEKPCPLLHRSGPIRPTVELWRCAGYTKRVILPGLCPKKAGYF